MTDPRIAALEVLATLEHEQWIEWSRTVAAQGLTPERLARWERYWVPYSELDEETKEHDRKWARLALAALPPDWCGHAVIPSRVEIDAMNAEIERLSDQIARQAAADGTLAVAFDAVRAEAEIVRLRKIEEAAREAVNRADADDDFDGQFIEYLVPAVSIDALRAALEKKP